MAVMTPTSTQGDRQEPTAPGGAPARFGTRPTPAPRTLVDVLDATVRAHPQEPALDDGRTRLSYRALAAEVAALRHRLTAAGVGLGDRVGVRVPSGTNDLYVGILAVLAGKRRLRTGGRRGPAGARRPGLRRGRGDRRAGRRMAS